METNKILLVMLLIFVIVFFMFLNAVAKSKPYPEDICGWHKGICYCNCGAVGTD